MDGRRTRGIGVPGRFYGAVVADTLQRLRQRAGSDDEALARLEELATLWSSKLEGIADCVVADAPIQGAPAARRSHGGGGHGAGGPEAEPARNLSLFDSFDAVSSRAMGKPREFMVVPDVVRTPMDQLASAKRVDNRARPAKRSRRCSVLAGGGIATVQLGQASDKDGSSSDDDDSVGPGPALPSGLAVASPPSTLLSQRIDSPLSGPRVVAAGTKSGADAGGANLAVRGPMLAEVLAISAQPAATSERDSPNTLHVAAGASAALALAQDAPALELEVVSGTDSSVTSDVPRQTRNLIVASSVRKVRTKKGDWKFEAHGVAARLEGTDMVLQTLTMVLKF